jgi:beta-mannosidase
VDRQQRELLGLLRLGLGGPARRGSWGRNYYVSVLPGIVAELDPTRPYWPGSPFSGDPDVHPNDPTRGTTHIWDVWNVEDYTRYRSYRPRFVSEFGFQGPPAYATLRAAVSDEPMTPRSPGLASHQKQVGGDEKLLRRLAGHLPVPTTMDDWHLATQLNQARAIRFGVEHFRSLRPLCMGTILWQINDCWPVSSWAIVDGYGRRKPVWYALRRAYADRLLTIQPRDGGLAVVAVNDGGTPWTERFEVSRRSGAGQTRAKPVGVLAVGPRDATTVVLPPEVAVAGQPSAELLVAGSGPGRALWFYVEDVDLACPEPGYEAIVEAADGGYRVTVTAATLLRDLVLAADRLAADAEVDDAVVTLLPGESMTFTVTTATAVDSAALTEPPVLRCAGHLLPGAEAPR